MKAKVKQVNQYEITIGDKTYRDFEKCESWEGMLKFRNKDGVILLSDDGNFSSTFISIFGEGHETESKEMSIMKASPEFIQTIES